MQAAAGGGHLDVVKLLLDYGANVNEGPASTDWRAASGGGGGGGAVEGGFCDAVGLLLGRGTDANTAATSDGLTVVRMAAAYGRYEVVKLLLENGAGFGAGATSEDFLIAALRDRDTRRRLGLSKHWYYGWSIFD